MAKKKLLKNYWTCCSDVSASSKHMHTTLCLSKACTCVPSLSTKCLDHSWPQGQSLQQLDRDGNPQPCLHSSPPREGIHRKACSPLLGQWAVLCRQYSEVVPAKPSYPRNPCSSTLQNLAPLARLYADEDHGEDYDDDNQDQDHKHLPVLLLVLLCLQKRREGIISP